MQVVQICQNESAEEVIEAHQFLQIQKQDRWVHMSTFQSWANSKEMVQVESQYVRENEQKRIHHPMSQYGYKHFIP